MKNTQNEPNDCFIYIYYSFKVMEIFRYGFIGLKRKVVLRGLNF